MKLIVGLGNPGIKYKKTRHNVGFLTIDNLQLTINKFSNWYFEKKFVSEISQGKMSLRGAKRRSNPETKSRDPSASPRDDNEIVILAKPQTYMNNSGQAVKLLFKNLKLKIKNLFIIHDDLDLALGKFKLQKGRGSAGHKGVQSIIDALGTKDFWRWRIGIRPMSIDRLPTAAEKFVLQKFNKEEEKILKEVIKKIPSTILPTSVRGKP